MIYKFVEQRVELQYYCMYLEWRHVVERYLSQTGYGGGAEGQAEGIWGSRCLPEESKRGNAQGC